MHRGSRAERRRIAPARPARRGGLGAAQAGTALLAGGAGPDAGGAGRARVLDLAGACVRRAPGEGGTRHSRRPLERAPEGHVREKGRLNPVRKGGCPIRNSLLRSWKRKLNQRWWICKRTKPAFASALTKSPAMTPRSRSLAWAGAGATRSTA